MSTILLERNISPNGEIDLTYEGSKNYCFNAFAGGIERGKCVQLTLDWKEDNIQFTKEQLKQFIEDCKTVLDK